MSGSFTQVFGGTTIYPADVSYLALALTADVSLSWPVGAGEGDSVVARIIDITPTGPFTVTLPDATEVSVGQTILFNNLGPDIVTIDTAAGNAILSIGAGEQWQCYLIDNTTIGGVWRTFRYGAAVAQAQAAALAGAGLVADGSELAQNYEVIDFSITPYSLTAPDRARVFVWGGGLGTLNLPTAVAAGDGWFVQVRNGGQGDLTIDPSGSELINAASTLRLQPGDSAVVVSDGVQWYTIGLGQQAVFAFDYTTIAVTGGTYTLAGSELNRIAYKFTGTLGSNANIVVPATVQQYWVNNATTGSFTLGVKTSSGTATLVNQGETAILYCDGTDIISATTSSPFAGVVPISQGGTGASNAPSALTNLGGTGIGTAVFSAATTAAGRSAIAAAASGANSDITSITGLTTALTVAQGGTGSTTAGGARTNLGAAASGSNADITALTNAAGIQIGSPTLGARGAGTINATGLFINGVGVGTGSGSVTSVAMTVPSFLSVSGSPITTSGTLAVSLSGTALPVANGGTGQTSYTDGQLLIGNSTGNTLTKATLTAGSGISITNSAGGITITSTAGGGTVTSVSGSGGSTGLTLTGGPITTSGTLTLGGTLAIANGGTGAATASGARLNLDTPSTSGSGATGTWGINITGSAASATTATTATTANALNASNTYTVAGLNSTGLLECTTPNAGTSGGIVLRGNATSGNAILQVRDSTGVSQWGFATITSAGTFSWSGQMTATQFNGSGAGLTGTASSLSIGGNAATVTNGVYTTGTQTIGGSKTFSSTVLLADGGFMFASDGAQDTGISWASDGVMNVRCNASTVGQFNGSGFTGNAATATTATTATTANALNTGNNYQVNSLGVGTAGSGTTGEIRATNNVTAFFSSDAKLKENVRPIENALGIVSAVGGKTFDWTDAYIAEHGGEDEYFVKKSDFGVIAQDVQAVFPLAVRKRPDGTLAVDYERLVAVAFAAIDQLKAELDELRGAK